jgi:hypothetical protein
MKSTGVQIVLATILAAYLAPPALAGGGWSKVRARLFGDIAVEGNAQYRERDRDGFMDRRFKVSLDNAVPGATYDVWIGSYFVDTIVADNLGCLNYKLRTVEFIDDDDDVTAMPFDFPVVAATDTIMVGALSGVFYDRKSESRQRFRMRMDMGGDGDEVDVTVKYRERLKHGLLLRRFDVCVEDGFEGDAHDVYVNGDLVGTIVLDELGEGKLKLRTREFIDDPDDGSALPSDFPSLLPGDTVTVGSVTGVFSGL